MHIYVSEKAKIDGGKKICYTIFASEANWKRNFHSRYRNQMEELLPVKYD